MLYKNESVYPAYIVTYKPRNAPTHGKRARDAGTAGVGGRAYATSTWMSVYAKKPKLKGILKASWHAIATSAWFGSACCAVPPWLHHVLLSLSRAGAHIYSKAQGAARNRLPRCQSAEGGSPSCCILGIMPNIKSTKGCSQSCSDGQMSNGKFDRHRALIK